MSAAEASFRYDREGNVRMSRALWGSLPSGMQDGLIKAIAYHAVCEGEVKLSPELVDWRLFAYDQVRCWPAGTGYALADWLRSRGHEPQFMEPPPRRVEET